MSPEITALYPPAAEDVSLLLFPFVSFPRFLHRSIYLLKYFVLFFLYGTLLLR